MGGEEGARSEWEGGSWPEVARSQRVGGGGAGHRGFDAARQLVGFASSTEATQALTGVTGLK